MQQNNQYALISEGRSVGWIMNPVIRNRQGMIQVLTRKYLELPVSIDNTSLSRWSPPVMAAMLEVEHGFVMLDEPIWFPSMIKVMEYLRGLDSN